MSSLARQDVLVGGTLIVHEATTVKERNTVGPLTRHSSLIAAVLASLGAAPPQAPELSRATNAERTMIESACSWKRGEGPAAYYRCVAEKLAELRRSAGLPDLSRTTNAERTMIESACSSKRGEGPAAYYRCVGEKLAELQRSAGQPDLSGTTNAERTMIESACSWKRSEGPAAYYHCVGEKLAELRRSAGLPDLGSTTNAERAMIESACSWNRGGGPAAYYHCVGEKLAELQRSASPVTPPPTPAPSLKLPTSPTAAPSLTAPLQPLPEPSPIPLVVVLGFAGYMTWRWLDRRKPCSSCGAKTLNAEGLCESCRARRVAEERQRHAGEARRKAREAREDQARAEAERRRQEEERARQVRTIEDLYRLSGPEFEDLIADLFRRDGYHVTRTGGPRDDGIDLVLMIGGSKDVVQCKPWRTDLGSPVIREFYVATIHAGARQAFVVTTASFSQSARDFASGKPIVFIDGRYLLAWIRGGRSTTGDQRQRPASTDGFDPYQVLGVKRGTSQEEIREAYLSLIKQYHPDRVSHLGPELRELASQKAQEINRAYQVLTST